MKKIERMASQHRDTVNWPYETDPEALIGFAGKVLDEFERWHQEKYPTNFVHPMTALEEFRAYLNGESNE